MDLVAVTQAMAMTVDGEADPVVLGMVEGDRREAEAEVEVAVAGTGIRVGVEDGELIWFCFLSRRDA